MAIGKLLDWSQARPPLAKVKAAGYSAAYRYVCSDTAEAGLPGKRLTPMERDQILAAGLDIGLHGEDQAQAAKSGYPKGLAQGKQWADYAHRILNAPKGMTIVAAIDYDTAGTYPTVVRDYLHGVTDGLDGQYRTGVYGSIYVVDAALAEKTAVHGVQTNAWSHSKISSWAQVYQHGPSEFPGTDYNDVLRVPHGTWLQTLGGDDMPFTDWPQADQDALADAVWKRGVTNPASGLVQAAGVRLVGAQAQDDLDKAVAAVLAQAKANGTGISGLATGLAGAVADLQTALAAVQAAIDALEPGTGGSGPLTVSLTGTATPA
jgi:hypothetical protein